MLGDATEGKGREGTLPLAKANGSHAPGDPWKEVYDYGKNLLGQSAGGIITNLRKVYDDKPRKVLAKLQDAAEVREPASWLNAFLQAHAKPGMHVGAAGRVL